MAKQILMPTDEYQNDITKAFKEGIEVGEAKLAELLLKAIEEGGSLSVDETSNQTLKSLVDVLNATKVELRNNFKGI
jgi:predicted transcriptional regulator